MHLQELSFKKGICAFKRTICEADLSAGQVCCILENSF